MPGWIAFASLIGVILASLAGLVAITPEIDLVQIFLDENIVRIVSNTLLQAALSTAVSLGLAIPFARALARRRYFWGAWCTHSPKQPLPGHSHHGCGIWYCRSIWPKWLVKCHAFGIWRRQHLFGIWPERHFDRPRIF